MEPFVRSNRETILDLVKREKIDFISLQFVDLFGTTKSVSIPVDKLGGAIDDNVWFDGSSISGFARIFESDMFLKLDLPTFAIEPWSTKNGGYRTARIICDVYRADGQPYEGCPRHILKKQIKKLKERGFDNYHIGPEPEFHIFRKDDDGRIKPLPHDYAGYFDQSTDLAGEIRREMASALMAMHIDVEALHHEVAHGQHEIDFKYADAVKTADNVLTLKYVLKTISASHGLHATFMPKPIYGICGNGMHVNQSLFRGGMNAFYDEHDSYNLSQLAKSFIAGQLKYIRQFNAITNPIVNSYKRLVVGYEAPVYITWARQNRSSLIRIPRLTAGNHNATRIELRCPDPACNPYLTFAVALAAGLKGVDENLTPPNPSEERNLFQLSEEEMQQEGIESVCGNLYEAICEMEKSEFVHDVLGDHAFYTFINAKKKEWDEYRQQVSQWELDTYLERY
ncbi:type I glutamate--ammonia ligase [Patescibacteria group bacterium]|nr:type I glutamate--ammonia ligase [Patescibacteria group bacterium]